MDRERVVSSDLASVGYDESSQILEVEFTNGAVYEYLRVPPGIHASLMSAPSHGRFFNEYVKKGGFAYRRIR